MLKSFLEYIFESESKTKLKLYYSKRFREFLSKIERTAKDQDVERLASAIRHSENSNQMYSDITFIDMTDKNDMLSFIQVNRVRRKYDDPNSKPTPENFDDFESWIEHIWNYDSMNSLWKDQRGEVKVGKFTKKIFKDNNIGVSDVTIEKFINIYKATFDFDFNLDQKLELVSGEDIRKWYLETNYSDRRGQLASSCMRYEKCQKYLDIYVQNPEVCSLLIMYSDASKTKICGRALIWKNVDGEFVMDRVYTVNDYDIEVFRKYASSKEWIDITKNHKVQKIQLKKGVVYDYYPYMDNFYIFNHKEGYLTNSDSNWPSDGYYKLQNTDGSYTSDEGVWSEYHDDYIDREDAIYCVNANDYVHCDSAIYLEYKDIYASPNEETVYSEWGDQSYYLDDTIHSDVMNDYILSDDAISIFVNHYGDEDYIANDFSKNALITVKYADDEVKTLSKFVILDPTTGQYHFRDEKVGDEKIQDVILNKLKDVEVDTDKIKEYLINLDFEINSQKMTDLRNIYKVWSSFGIGNNNITKGLIKYLLYAYPDKVNQRGGLPTLPQERGLTSSEKYLRFKNMIINFDPELLDILTKGESQKVKESSNDFIFNFTSLTQGFIDDVFKDPEIYKMWYKWKHS
jgi:hypothetical protein